MTRLCSITLLACSGIVVHHAMGQDLLNDSLSFSGEHIHLKKYSSIPNNKIISMTSRPGDGTSLYVTTQSGSVYQVDPSGSPTEWFNYDSLVNTAFTTASDGYVLEQPKSGISVPHGGLRSVAYHPDFETNGKFYTSAMVDRPSNTSSFNYLGNPASGFDAESVVVEWAYNHNTGKVNANSYRELFRVSMPFFDHPIKQMAFNYHAKPGDEDYGLLYIAHGDGSVQSATVGGGLNRNDALGKVLRINPLQSGANAYTTPNSPFANDPATLDEIYTLGHRNPHHLAFGVDPSGNTYVIVAEVGRDNIEEINILQAGGNYGWSDREGTFVHINNASGYLTGVSDLPANEWALNDYIYPAAQYDHNVLGSFSGTAVAGGAIVDNTDSSLKGQFIFLDFGSVSGHVYHASFDEILAAHTQLADGESPDALTQAEIFRYTLTLDSDGDGEIDHAADNINDLIGRGRNDARFGIGPNGEIFISSKQTGEVYLVTNLVANVPEPSSLALLGLGGLLITRRRRG